MDPLEPVHMVAARSLAISGLATLLAASWGLPLAFLLASRPRARPVVAILDALVGVPTVLVGLLLYLLLSRQGPLGFLQLLYTPTAIVIGEAVLVTPLLVSVAYRSLRPTVESVSLLVATFGGAGRQALLLSAREAAPGLASSIAMAFSRAVGELGVALVVGGNIKGYTRTLSTSIALATAMGEYEAAVKLGAVLAALSLGFSLAVRLVRREWGIE